MIKKRKAKKKKSSLYGLDGLGKFNYFILNFFAFVFASNDSKTLKTITKIPTTTCINHI